MIFPDCVETVYRRCFGENGAISLDEFRQVWQSDEAVIHFVKRQYPRLSREPMDRINVFKRLMSVVYSGSDELLEKALLLMIELISMGRPDMGDYVPAFFDGLYDVAVGDVFWEGHFDRLMTATVEWLEGNPYGYSVYKFWNLTCGVDVFEKGEIVRGHFDQEYYGSLRQLYQAAKADYHRARKKLAELDPGSLKCTLYKRLQKYAGEHLEYYNIGKKFPGR